LTGHLMELMEQWREDSREHDHCEEKEMNRLCD
jgi:hypothetical protein